VIEELHKAAGWTDADGMVRGPQGATAWLEGGGGGLPDHQHLCLAGETDGHRFAFAVSLVDEYNLSGIAKQSLCGPDAVAAGAVVPWLDRTRDRAGVWGRAGDGPWWPLGGGVGKHKVPRPSGQVQERVTAWLETLVRDPAAEAVDRAERTQEILRGAGWRPANSRTGRAKSGFRCLTAATLRGQDGAKHRVEYVLMGDARLPEAVVWRYKLPAAEEQALLIDITGALRPDVPLGASGDRLAAVLGVLTREAPAMDAGRSRQVLMALLTVASALRVGRGFSSHLVRFPEGLGDGFPTEVTVPLAEAGAAVRAEPADGTRWLTLGLAALKDGLRHLAVEAFAKAVELSTGDPEPLLWHGWALRALDRDLALAQLDRAATAGGVVGLVRTCQANVLRMHGDWDAALRAYARATEEDPGQVGAWLSRGLHLAKYGQVTQAVQVLTEATAIHLDGRVAYYLGYARLLADDQDGALDALEEAVRRNTALATAILDDEDLAPLRGQARFDALPAFAARHAVAMHRRIREATRPTEPPPVLPRDRANDLPTVVKALGIFVRRVDGYRRPHAEGVTHAATRRFLETVGLPREAGEFQLDQYFDGLGDTALHEYDTMNHRCRLYGARNVPAGLAGLFVLGTLGNGAEAAVDGETGEVYHVSEDYSVSWLATDLEEFLLPRCLPEDTWVWRLTTDTLHFLDSPDIPRINTGKLAIVAERLDDNGHERLRAFLREHGHLLNLLHVTASIRTEANLADVDLAAHCPNLTELRLRRGTVNESVFQHPALKRLVLTESEYKGARHLILDTGSRLTNVSLHDSLVYADTLRVGPGSPLRSFRAAIDEDYGFEFPGRLEFDNCPDLFSISLSFQAGTWNLVLNGRLPQLGEVQQDARPYGSFTSTVEAATPSDKKAYQSMIRKGARYARRG
jgi:tetratricopeptide (TPR) repeat protein